MRSALLQLDLPAPSTPLPSTPPPTHTHPMPRSFSFGAAALLNPSLGFDASFLEEPVMLLAFVLLGRAMEARAKVRGGQLCG